MLKLTYPDSSFQNIKCGEIFCISPAVFNVTCLLCSQKMHLEIFAVHFQLQHLTQAEESINLDDLDRKAKDATMLDNMVIEDEDDPIKQEDFTDKTTDVEDAAEGDGDDGEVDENEEGDEDDKCLQQLINEIKSSKHKKEVTEMQDSDIEPRKRFTRNYNKRRREADNTEIQTVLPTMKKETIDSETLSGVINLRKEEMDDDPSDDGHGDKEWTDNVQDKEVISSEPDTNTKDALPYNCLICNRSYRIKHSLQKHNHSVHNPNKPAKIPKEPKPLFKCEECNEVFRSKTNLRAHIRKHAFESDGHSKDERPYSCLICKRSYRTKHCLQKHNHSVHNPNKPVKKPKEPKPQHKCDECNEVFRSERNLRAHQWKHTGIFCDICGKPFAQIGDMMRHKIRHTGVKDYKCKECSKEFFTAKELKSHMICHTGLMPYICEICGKRCRDHGVLTSHMRRHTGERPAKCHVCGKSFFSFHDLNVHAVTHSSQRPFKCDVCGSTFQRKKALRVHKLIHSEDRKHVCKICGKSFAQSGGLNSHMRTHDTAVGKSNTEPTSVHIPSILIENLCTNVENQVSSSAGVAGTIQVLAEYLV